MDSSSPVVVVSESIEEEMVCRVLTEEGRRLSAKLQRRKEEESLLMQQLHSICDELISVEMELDKVRTSNERYENSVSDDPEVECLLSEYLELERRLGGASVGGWLSRLALLSPWRDEVAAACTRRDEAYEWGSWTVWSRWRSGPDALPSPLRELACGGALFTDSTGREVVNLAQGVGADWQEVEPWRPVADWNYGDSVEELVSGDINQQQAQQSAAARALGWPPKTLRRRLWAREARRRRVPGAGELANRVLDLKATSAATQAFCAKLRAQVDGLEHLLEDSDARCRQVNELDSQLAAAKRELAQSRDGLKRNQLLVAASRRTPSQKMSPFFAQHHNPNGDSPAASVIAAVEGLLSSSDATRSVAF